MDEFRIAQHYNLPILHSNFPMNFDPNISYFDVPLLTFPDYDRHYCILYRAFEI